MIIKKSFTGFLIILALIASVLSGCTSNTQSNNLETNDGINMNQDNRKAPQNTPVASTPTPAINSNKDIPTEKTQEKAIAIAAGDEHNLIVKADGTVWAFGNNRYGQLGDGTKENRYLPIRVHNLSNVITVSGGVFHSLALKDDGSVWSWGANRFGQLGDGTSEDKASPVQVKELKDVIAINASGYNSIALKKDGTVWVWGDNSYSQVGGDSGEQKIPKQIPNLNNVVAIASGGSFYLAVKSDGSVWAWGWNRDVYLCIGSNNEIIQIPQSVKGVEDIISVSASAGGIMALKKDGTVWKWGQVETPEQIKELKDIFYIYQGVGHGLAIDDKGNLWSWGDNRKGQIGNGKFEKEDIPVLQVAGMAGVTFASGGAEHTIALINDGSVWSWGSNEKGQLGDGEKNNRATPSKIIIK